MKKSTSLANAPLAPGMSAAFAHGEDQKAPARDFDERKVEATDFGREGDPKKVTRTIKVDMADTMRFSPARRIVKPGEPVRFVVHNDGKVLHEMVLGRTGAIKAHAELMKKFPEMKHADANMAHVRPERTGDMVWQFTEAGEFEFACLQPGHFEAGMVGKGAVK